MTVTYGSFTKNDADGTPHTFITAVLPGGKEAICQVVGYIDDDGNFVAVTPDTELPVVMDSELIAVPADPDDNGKVPTASSGEYVLRSPFASGATTIDYLLAFAPSAATWAFIVSVIGDSTVLIDQTGADGPAVGLYTITSGAATLTTPLSSYAAYTVLTVSQVIGGALGPTSFGTVPYVVGVGPIVAPDYVGAGIFLGLGAGDIPLATESIFDSVRLVKGYTLTAVDPTLYASSFDNADLPVLDNGVTAAPGDFIATLAPVAGGTLGGVDGDTGDNWITYVKVIDGSHSQLVVSPGSDPVAGIPSTNPLAGGCSITTLNGYKLIFHSDSGHPGPDTFTAPSFTGTWFITPPGPFVFATATDDAIGQDGNLGFVVSTGEWATKSGGTWTSDGTLVPV